MKIRILSKTSFLSYITRLGVNRNNVESFYSLGFICINGTTKSKYDAPILSDAPNVLNLFFDDVETDIEITLLSPTKQHVCKAFTPDQGILIIDFLESMKANGIDELIIHCHAGVSRSGAVGTFAREYLELDLKEFRELNPNIYPNAKVLRELNNIIWRRKGIYGKD